MATTTETWLAENYDELNKTLQSFLSYKFPLSSQRDIIEDHISNFMCELLAKDTLSGESNLTVKGVASLAFNSTHNHIRTLSKDPAHKLRYGGMTEAERRKAQESGVSVNDYMIARNELLKDQLQEQSSIADLSPEDQVAYVEHIKAMEDTLARHSSLKRPDKRDRAMKVFNLMLEGYGNREIAHEVGITIPMANKWVAKVRLILDSHRLALA